MSAFFKSRTIQAALIGAVVLIAVSFWQSSRTNLVTAKFSDTQTIRGSQAIGEQNALYLDNSGTLTPKPATSSSSNSITLILNVVPLTWPDGKGGGTEAYWFNPEEEYHFNSYDSDQKTHEIRIGNRTFLVTLFRIINTGSSDKPNFEYQFGISEE